VTATLDYSVYPDLENPPTTLATDADRADYVARICGAWDFDIVPTRETFALFATWRTVFDRFPLVDSPAYAAFRVLYGWPRVSGGHVLQADYERIDGTGDPLTPFW
jgi:hypothetical protein